MYDLTRVEEGGHQSLKAVEVGPDGVLVQHPHEDWELLAGHPHTYLNHTPKL